MKGSTHAAIGAVSGFGVSVSMNAAPFEMIILTGIGSIAALVPDLDVNGKLANKITVEKKWLILFFSMVGLFLMVYSYFMLIGIKQMSGFLISISLFLLPRLFIKQRTMLFVTGAIVLYAGWYIKETWVVYIALFILFASLVSHRTWTHSIIGVAGFYFVAVEIAKEYPLPGLFTTLLISYISHLIADMKILPPNKKGVKWFYPIWKKEF